MGINKYGEIVRGKEGQEMKQECLGAKDSNCGLKMMSRKERYEYLFKQVSEVKEELRTANTEKSVNTALDKLEDLMDKLMHDSQVADVEDWEADIAGTIRGVKLHDITRSILDKLLKDFLERVAEIIAAEKQKENAGKLKTLFLELAEHSEEIAKIIDINKIFG